MLTIYSVNLEHKTKFLKFSQLESVFKLIR